MEQLCHSVTLDKNKCKGCINCMKYCPTEAIRVRNGKATILHERCIDCGECIRACQNRAKKAVCDSFEQMDNYKYKIALPAPSFYGQFANLDDVNYILTALLEIGFDSVFEVSRAAELVSDYSRHCFSKGTNNIKKPVISSACPTVLRLISVRFPNLISHVLPIIPPYALAAKMAKEEAVKRTGLLENEVCVAFISPCPAKVTDSKHPIGFYKSYVDVALPANKVYKKILSVINKIDSPEPLSSSGIVGISWAGSGGESAALLQDNYLAADGIQNCIKVLEEIEDDKLTNADFVELNACPGGCVGGVLNIENPFIAKARINTMRKYMPVSLNRINKSGDNQLEWKLPLEKSDAMQLHNNIHIAMDMMKQIEIMVQQMPGYDCGVCGSPSCRAFCEDVVLGYASPDMCVVKKISVEKCEKEE